MWTGNKENPVPNNVQKSNVKSQEKISINRAEELRRDSDEKKNFTITLLDIDDTIKNHLERIQITVTDEGGKLKVPIFHASPDKWASIQRDGVIRDYNGMILLPAITFKRTNTDTDANMQMFNRYLSYSVMEKYSKKNKYTPFNLLTSKNVPLNDVYDVVMPDHMIFTYHFIVWTEYVSQMNQIIERIKFESEDYWGDPNRFKFRTRIEGFSHTIELQSDQDRIVKTEFDLIVNGYLLPDIFTKVGISQSTTKKWMTPKKIIVGAEVVYSGYDFDKLDKNKSKWRSQYYHNLQSGDEPVAPSVSFIPDIEDTGLIKLPSVPILELPINLVWHFPPPENSSDYGISGWQSYDNDYYYLYTDLWRRVPISLFEEQFPPGYTFGYEGQAIYVGEYFYIYMNGKWKRVPISLFNAYVIFYPISTNWHYPPPSSSSDPGQTGWQSYDSFYYYYYTTYWKRIPLSLFSDNPPPGHETGSDGEIVIDGLYFYIFMNGNWKRVPIIQFNAYVSFY